MRHSLLALPFLLFACGSSDAPTPAPTSTSTLTTLQSTERPHHWMRSLGTTHDPRIAYDDTPTIPVLLLHEICPVECGSADTYGMTAANFDALLTRLAELGYETISSADFAAFRRGRAVTLPRRPFYLTFDDGREDAYLGATPVLTAHHARATMFVITDKPGVGPHFMTWAQVQEASASGTWDIELHARSGHEFVQTGSTTTGHFFAVREWSPASAEESMAAWRVRTQTDIALGEADLDAHLPGRVAHSFAVPYGDYGQSNAVDPDIQRELRSFLDAKYEAWFTQLPDPPFARLSPGGETYRYTVFNTTTVAAITAWLAKHEAP